MTAVAQYICPRCQARHRLAPLTPRQHDVATYYRDHRQQNGYSPSFQEIADEFGFMSLATVHEHIENLIRKGWLTRLEANAARMIVLTEAAESAL